MSIGSLATPLLILVFVAAAGGIWVAGIRLASSTQALDTRFHLGSAIGGLLLLAIATDLPELAIAITAALNDNLGLAVGNLLGGVAIQTLVLAALDAAAGPDRPLTYMAGSLLVVLEGALVALVTVAAIMTAQLPEKTNFIGVSPGTIAIVLMWLVGLKIIAQARGDMRWQVKPEGARPGRTYAERRRVVPKPHKQHSPSVVLLIFAAAAAVTLVAGVLIEMSGDELAGRAGLSGPVFGATILAAATALPELSTGLAAVRDADIELAISDILGGNAVLPALFIFVDLFAGRPALPGAAATDTWIAGLGVLLTGIYMVGVILRPKRTFWRMGPDSIAAITVYALGIGGLFLVAN
ncbi:MAG: cation:H+ antiporter [Thermoleophilaceae bacterium]|nr:cation:H+ antiporter [Thermoleophilaceae bacterium]